MQNISWSPYLWLSSWKIQGEHGSLHQDILDFEDLYQGQHNENMMGDYIWGLIRESDLQYTRNSRKLLISETFWVIFDSLCLLTMQVLFFISPHEQKCKNSLFCHNRYEIFLGCVHKINVCAECSCFFIGFKHKQLKCNTWKPGTNIVLHSVTDDLNFSSDDSD